MCSRIRVRIRHIGAMSIHLCVDMRDEHSWCCAEYMQYLSICDYVDVCINFFAYGTLISYIELES